MKPKLLTTLKTYSWSEFRHDIVAGLTVAMVALPLSIAIAIASGADPSTGLVTAIIGGFLISLLGGSRVQIGGPTGAFIVVVFSVIADHGYDGLVAATLLAGFILAIAGFLRAGNLIAYIPEAVINGFTMGIGIIIATSQLKDCFGLSLNTVPADFLDKVPALWAARSSFNPVSVSIAAATLGLIIVFRKLSPRLPGSIIAVALTSVVVAALALPVDTIASRFGTLSVGLPAPSIPQFTAARLIELVPSALVIAFLAGVESLLSAMVADRMIESSHRPNAELVAQGFANIGSAMFGGLPATGAIARTATNVRAGAKTPVAGLIHAIAILAIMVAVGALTGYMSMPALAALLLLTAYHMSEPHKWPALWAAPLEERLLLALTLVLTVVADLSIAIGSGVALGLVLLWWRNWRAPSDWTTPER